MVARRRSRRASTRKRCAGTTAPTSCRHCRRLRLLTVPPIICLRLLRVGPLFSPRMSDRTPDRPHAAAVRQSFAIVASQYNEEFVHGLVDSAMAELQTLVPELFVSLHEVPGAFEIPLLVREMASHENVDAVIALGVIIRGETSHAEFIARAVTESLQRISLDFAKPVIHEVLLVENVAQARRRCLEAEINRGTESARAAVAVLETLREARRK